MIGFFTKEEEQRIIKSIRSAEKNTSGEIRVHLESNCRGDIFKAAIRTFRRLKMHKTAARNGVLLFLVPDRKAFAILGDEAINDIVDEDFWENEKKLLEDYFRQGLFAEGLCQVLKRVGKKLKNHFPYQKDDINELPDDISYS